MKLRLQVSKSYIIIINLRYNSVPKMSQLCTNKCTLSLFPPAEDMIGFQQIGVS